MNISIKKFSTRDLGFVVIVPTIIQNTTGPNTVGGLVAWFATWLLYFAGVLAFIFLVYSGILYITSGGNPEQQKRAQSSLISAILGIVIISLAYVILRVANNLALGVI